MTETQSWGWKTPEASATGQYTIERELKVERRIPLTHTIARSSYVPPRPSVSQFTGGNSYTGWGGFMQAMNSGKAARWTAY